MIKKIKEYIKEDKWFIIIVIIIFLIFNIKLPYYINMPGGTIKINDRISCSSCNDINGSLNMLYVTEYVATIPTYLLSYVIPNWDLENISEQQVNNESVEEINIRNKLMLENSIDNATYVAYTNASKYIKTKSKKTIIITSILDNGLKIGDEILKVNGNDVENTENIKKIVSNSKVGDKLSFRIRRNEKEIDKDVKVSLKDGEKVIGVIITTDYIYDIDPEIDIKFKRSESGSSGGFMMALSMYIKLTEEDIIKGRNIAGTGTISRDGSVGEIDGIKYKIMGAVHDKMDIVLVPSGNYKEAMKVVKKNKYNIKIVKIDTFKDAIDYLKNN